MKTRPQRLVSLLVLALVLALPAPGWAKGKGFKDVIKHIETNYRAKKTRIPMLGLANFAVKLIRPAGVKGFKLAVFEDQDFAPRPGETSFVNVMRDAYTPQKGWKPLVQTNSKREGQQRAFIFIKENKKDIEVAVTTLAEREAAVIEVKFSPDKLVQFLDNPRLMGISLGKSLRNQPDPANKTAAQTAGQSGGAATNAVSENTVLTATAGSVTEATIKTAPRATSDKAAADAAEETPTAVAQTTPATVEPRDPNAIRIETRLVNLNVRALNQAGQPLLDLKPEDFHVFEDEAKQDIAHFKPVNTPVNLLVLLDMSGSTQKKHKTMIESVRKFIDLLPANDKMSIVAFTRKYHRLTPFTADKTALKAAVEKIKKIHGGTAYYDAMVESMADLEKLGDTRKAIVVLTDGEDESMFGQEPTGFTFEQMLQRAAESDVTIYPIYFTSDSNQYQRLGVFFGGAPGNGGWQNERRSKARKQLQAVADQTGGDVVNAQNETDLAGAYARVAKELHTIYSLAYSPDKLKHDGAFRKIAVKVNRPDALAKTRKGYYDK